MVHRDEDGGYNHRVQIASLEPTHRVCKVRKYLRMYTRKHWMKCSTRYWVSGRVKLYPEYEGVSVGTRVRAPAAPIMGFLQDEKPHELAT